MLNQLLIALLFSLLAGLSAGVYVSVLTQPGHVLAFVATWLYRLRDKYEDFRDSELIVVTPPNKEGFGGVYEIKAEAEHARAERKVNAEYWLKPVLTCGYCVGGQLGFWGLLSLAGFSLSPVIYILTACCSSLIGGLVANFNEPKL